MKYVILLLLLATLGCGVSHAQTKLMSFRAQTGMTGSNVTIEDSSNRIFIVSREFKELAILGQNGHWKITDTIGSIKELINDIYIRNKRYSELSKDLSQVSYKLYLATKIIDGYEKHNSTLVNKYVKLYNKEK